MTTSAFPKSIPQDGPQTYEGRFNPEAFGAHVKWEQAYLRANGWQDSGGLWTHPGLRCFDSDQPMAPTMKAYTSPIHHGHAVNAQRLFDSRCASYINEVRASLGLDTSTPKG